MEVYSLKALQASPSFAAYEVEGDELAQDMSSFAMANAIYAALVEGHAAEVSDSCLATFEVVLISFFAASRPSGVIAKKRYGERFEERRGDD